MKKILIPLVALSLFFASCKDDTPEPVAEETNTVPEFFSAAPSDIYGTDQPELTLIANQGDGVLRPNDLDFIKTRSNELWVLNKGTENTGGSTVTITNVGQADQKAEYRKDANSWHFMSLPTALSFSENGNWATSAGVRDANHNGGTFTGPSLWSSNMGIYARPSGGNGSHIDMLHGSPFSMGIESERENIFWVFDGFNQEIVRYDFVSDHGPGNDDHSDGLVWRYAELAVKMKADVPSHLVLDKAKKWLYIVDGGNNRILRLDITTGSKAKAVPLINELLAEHYEMSNTSWDELIGSGSGMKSPCGIEVSGNRLFVSDYETGEIICFDATTGKELARIDTGDKGITGIKIGPNGKLWYTNLLTHEVLRVDPR